MPNLGVFHPQVVHFAIALLLVGVAFRVAALLLAKWTWVSRTATALLILGATAATVSVKTGDDAHGPVERIPGARALVEEHEELGERARNIFIAVAALELVALALTANRQRLVFALSAVVGIVGSYTLYHAAQHGGELVYSYAGGVGTRSGQPEDVNRLLLAGLYQQAQLDRKNGKLEDAAALITEMTRRFPDDAAVRFLGIESLLRDRGDAAGTLAALDAFAIPPDNRRLQSSVAMLRADALVAAGRRDEARAVIQSLLDASPGNARLQAKLDSLR